MRLGSAAVPGPKAPEEEGVEAAGLVEAAGVVGVVGVPSEVVRSVVFAASTGAPPPVTVDGVRIHRRQSLLASTLDPV